MIILAVVGTLAAIVWTFLVVMANGMSDAPAEGFQFGGTLALAWLGVLALWSAWYF